MFYICWLTQKCVRSTPLHIGRDSRYIFRVLLRNRKTYHARRFSFHGKQKKRTNYPHFIGVRLSDFELDRLDQNAKLLGISRSEYVRKLLIEKEIKNHIEIVAGMDDLKKLVGEYGKIGSNLNQIAKYFNTGGMRSLAIEDEIHQCIADLFKLRKKVLEMAGDTDGSS